MCTDFEPTVTPFHLHGGQNIRHVAVSCDGTYIAASQWSGSAKVLIWKKEVFWNKIEFDGVFFTSFPLISDYQVCFTHLNTLLVIFNSRVLEFNIFTQAIIRDHTFMDIIHQVLCMRDRLFFVCGLSKTYIFPVAYDDWNRSIWKHCPPVSFKRILLGNNTDTLVAHGCWEKNGFSFFRAFCPDTGMDVSTVIGGKILEPCRPLFVGSFGSRRLFALVKTSLTAQVRSFNSLTGLRPVANLFAFYSSSVLPDRGLLVVNRFGCLELLKDFWFFSKRKHFLKSVLPQ